MTIQELQKVSELIGNDADAKVRRALRECACATCHALRMASPSKSIGQWCAEWLAQVRS